VSATATTTAHERALDGGDYDQLWRQLDDFARYNPGARHRRRITRQLLSGLRVDSVLDVGCGNGEGLLALRRALPQVRSWHGADFAPECLAGVQRRLPDVQVHRLDLERDALACEFELVVCSEVIEHLRDRQAAFARLVRMVAPGGYLLITAPAGRVFATERHFGHVAHPSAAELRALCAEHGLRERALRAWGFPFYRMLKHATNLRPAWSLRHFADGRYGAGQRALAQVAYALCFVDYSHLGTGCQLFGLFQKAPG
jgi:trans-aconitate methyltransferase